jgi:hypothetical protein
MLKALRAMTAAALVSTAELRGKSLGDIARHAKGERRLRSVEAAPALMHAATRAEMASMWVGGGQALCRVSARYAEAAPHFGRILRLQTAPAEAFAPAGARGLMRRLEAAGYIVPDEERLAASVPVSGAATVRVLKEAPARSRRAAWDQDGARRAA